MKHVGLRPEGEIKTTQEIYKTESSLNYFYKNHVEEFEDGSKKIWNARTLASGCGNETKSAKRLGELIYCEHCDEYFNKEQFE